jgi:hypothetical protein
MGNENLRPVFADQRHRRRFLSAAAPAGQNVGPGSKRIDQRKCPDNSQADLSMIIDEMDRRPRHSRAEELMCDV